MTYIPVEAQNIASKSAFGDNTVVPVTPRVQLSFVGASATSPSSDIIKTAINDGSASIANSTSRGVGVTAGSAANARAAFVSKRTLRYGTGQGGLARFTCVFADGGKAHTTQYIGLGNAEDGFFFGYQGTEFGILRRYGGQVHVGSLTITGSAGINGNITITLDGEAQNVAILTTDTPSWIARKITDASWQQIGRGWDVYQQGSVVYFVSHTAAPRTAGVDLVFSAGGTGAVAVFATESVGIAPTEEWIPQSSWNEDKADGSGDLPNVDWTKGNIFQIRFQWLGFGSITFCVADTEGGAFKMVHRIDYAGTATTTSIRNPSLTLSVENTNDGTGPASGVTMYTPSMAAFVEGDIDDDLGPLYCSVATSSVSTTSLYPLTTIQSHTVFQGRSNRFPCYVRFINIGIDGGGVGGNGTTANVYVYKNARPVDSVNTLVFAGVNTNSVMRADTLAGTTTSRTLNTTGATLITVFQVGRNGDGQLRFFDNEFEIAPGDTITIAVACTNVTSSPTVDTSITWVERQ